MKKIMFWRLMIAAIVLSVASVMSSCNRLPEDIKLSDQLVAYAEFGENNDTLWGVKDSYGMVIKPYQFKNFAFDGQVITCLGQKENVTYAFTEKGNLIGKFELFTHWVENGEYYLGVFYKDRTFFFPQSGEVVKASNVVFGVNQMFIEVGKDVEIRDYNGEKIWTLPTQDAIVFQETGQDEYYIFAPKDWSKPPFAVYDINGKLVKKVPYPQYRKLIKRAMSLKAFNTVAILEAKNVLK